MSRKTKRVTVLVASMLLLSMLCQAAGSKTIYVDDDAAGLNDGSSWMGAYVYLQDALADANSTEEPVEIRVAQGTYKPDEGTGITRGDREAAFQLINGVTLKGGYAGSTETDPNTRDIELYKTILSGDLNDDDVEIVDLRNLLAEPTRAENSYHVVTGDNIDDTVVLDGLIITAGNANVYPNDDGGGLLNWRSSTKIVNCTFKSNAARDGGGMYNAGNSSPILTNCTFRSNYADFGGGLHNAGENSNPVITNCTFSGNAADYGGGMNNWYGKPSLIGCIFISNIAEDGGGMRNEHNGNPVITDCIFTENTAGYGGGMTNERNGSPVLTNCKFNANVAEYGGAINNFSSFPTLRNCTLSGNSAIFYGGAMYNYGSVPAIINCLLSGNTANVYGGGLSSNFSNLMLTNCVFSKNFAPNGSILTCNSLSQKKPSTITIINSILCECSSGIWNNDNSDIVITYSNFQGGWPGEGNIDADPLFAESGSWADANDPNITVEPNDPNAIWVDGDYHLKSQAGRWDLESESWVIDDVTSPCIDAGDPNSDWSGETWPHGGRINMGAYGGTREASMSIRPEAMSLPHIAYIHNSNSQVAQSYQSLLVSYGCTTELINLDTVGATSLDSYDLIVVGTDTGFTSKWGDAQAVAAIESSGKPVLGLGEGGYAFFGKLGLSVGYPNGAHGDQNSIYVIDPNNLLFSTPYGIDMPEDRVLQLYTETAYVGLYLWPVPEGVTALGGEADNPGYYPLALEQNQYMFWGFEAFPGKMTEVGRTLFINVVIRTANNAW